MEADKELLESYVRNGSEAAFRELVQRHINMVYSAALRESRGNAGMAEDIAQAVFIEFAGRAKKLASHPALAGWLYTCVRRMAANVRRADDRRQRREQEAFMMNEILGATPSDDLWQQVRPIIDDAMHELDEEDRAVVVLRFFEGKSFKDVGAAFGLNENAARMRCERSLERLRGLLSRRGVTSTASTLAAVLAVGATTSAPAALASNVSNAALSVGAGTGATVAVAKLLSKTQLAAGMLLVAVIGLVVWTQVRPNRLENAKQPLAAVLETGVGPRETPTHAAASDAARVAATTSPTTLHVVDAESGEPLPGAKLHAPYFRQAGPSQRVKRVTDGHGKVVLDPLRPPFEGVNLFVTADGHVPKVVSWGYGRPMPAEYTMKLDRGVTVAGLVADEGGQAIADATIEVDGPGNNSTLSENIQFGPDAEIVTDADGRWSCNMIPKDVQRLSLLVTHPDYAETTVPINSDAGESSVIVMKRGFTLAGAVQDWNGNPIQGASVREVRLNEEREHSGATDANGAFQFSGMNAGDVVLAVQAQGFAPQVQTVQVTGPVSGIRFQLRPGELFRGRVTDDEGHPIANAWVETARGRRKIPWSTTTDAHGRFAWDSAPHEPLLYLVEAVGFRSVYSLELRADGSEHEITLTRRKPEDMIQISGTALDADSGKPLDRFKVLLSEIEEDHAFPFRFFTEGKHGNFSFSLTAESTRSNYLIQIESQGYVPATSTPLSRAQGNQQLALQLHKGSGPSGVVRLPNGEPAANASVLLCTSGGCVTLNGPARIQHSPDLTKHRTQTDQAGRFSLPAASDPQAVVAVHDEGYAKVSLAALDGSRAIVLQPWGRVEGRLVLDGKPVANERVVAGHSVFRYSDSGQRFALTSFYFETKTDSTGSFAFDKVPPGRCNVYRQTLLSRTGFESHETSVVIDPGVVTRVLLGGSGRAVIGKATVPGARQRIDWQRVPVHLKLKTEKEPGPYPARGDFASRDAYIQAVEFFDQARRAQLRYGAMCDADGSFRIPDVPAGQYKLEITARGFNPDSVAPNVDSGFLPEIASYVDEITVPELVIGESNEPLDLGTVELKRP